MPPAIAVCNMHSVFRTYSCPEDRSPERGKTDGHAAEPDCAAPQAGAGAAQVPRSGADDLRGRCRAPGVLDLEDQPDRDRAGAGVTPGRTGHARPLPRARATTGQPGAAGPG